jgi:alcohol dehydrogenase class IV
MEPFEFFSVPRIVFGRGTLQRIPELARGLGDKAMVVTNAGQPGDGGAVDGLADLLAKAGMGVTFYLQQGEPTVDGVDRALQTARQDACQLVIGLGGGSAIDTAKAVAGLLANGGSPLDYMEVIGRGQPLTARAVPWIAVPTTAGTGAEVTKNAVLGSPEQRFKASLRSQNLLARIALVDPELAVSVPAAVTASSGMDALCQLIESYTSNRAQPITDALAVKGIALAARALPRAYADGSDLQAREEMAMAALLSGVTLANVGLGAVHGFAAPMGANFPIPHGAVCAVLLPPVVAANIAALQAEAGDHPVLARYAELGRLVSGHDEFGADEAQQALVDFLTHLVRSLDIPSLKRLGVGSEHFPELVALARKASSMRYNPVVLSDRALTDVLEAASG